MRAQLDLVNNHEAQCAHCDPMFSFGLSNQALLSTNSNINQNFVAIKLDRKQSFHKNSTQ